MGIHSVGKDAMKVFLEYVKGERELLREAFCLLAKEQLERGESVESNLDAINIGGGWAALNRLATRLEVILEEHDAGPISPEAESAIQSLLNDIALTNYGPTGYNKDKSEKETDNDEE